MKKIILLCRAALLILTVAGCEKIHSVEEFKKNEKLRDTWGKKCVIENAIKSSKNCQNLLQADNEIFFSQKPVSTKRRHGF
ncbi:EexN family lipoprotein [Bartonella koehlerae]|uniref:Uncharacterized protein n=1 Tax=Bartonella koehlerae C-29 TaxID=1134510 RepID=A0A067W2L0_9HYPH|nr:EexN family lipoprotein [Bartonella koehlerae]KEC54030.1 hypothetical protein O9A_01420 [Bartonella koehlerae C-29]